MRVKSYLKKSWRKVNLLGFEEDYLQDWLLYFFIRQYSNLIWALGTFSYHNIARVCSAIVQFLEKNSETEEQHRTQTYEFHVLCNTSTFYKSKYYTKVPLSDKYHLLNLKITWIVQLPTPVNDTKIRSDQYQCTVLYNRIIILIEISHFCQQTYLICLKGSVLQLWSDKRPHDAEYEDSCIDKIEKDSSCKKSY